jgi:hypothetical protein
LKQIIRYTFSVSTSFKLLATRETVLLGET